MELPRGTLLKQGQYHIESTLGEGGFGITYRGIDFKTSRQVAIKENWPDSGVRQGTQVLWTRTTPQQQQEELHKFKSEAQYLFKCIHPHVVRVYDWFEENNTAYSVMNFVPGKSLSDIFMEQGKLQEDELINYFLQITAALQVVHLNNLLHRDIKPENILIDRQGQAILIDFGATREYIAGKTGRMTAILTPGYAPIEQYSLVSQRGAGTDIYALCASMYHLLTGEEPPDSITRYPHDNLIPPRLLLPTINPQLEKVILNGMARELPNRFATATQLIQALNKITGNSRARLLSLKANSPRIEFILDGSQAIVGRSDSVPGSVQVNLENFPQSETVSRKHGIVYREGINWKVKDLGATNGIFIKSFGQTRFSRKITVPEKLNSGDEIAFGRVRLLFQTY